MTKTTRDRRVLAVSKDNWSWAVWLVTTQLKDGARTPEIVEDIAVEVSNRFDVRRRGCVESEMAILEQR
jgi:hypothetical protein